MSTRAGWGDILDADEEIVWQGRPSARVALNIGHVFTFFFGFFFAGFALFWMVMASTAGGVFWMFGLIHFTAGLGVMFGPIFWPSWVRRHTWYTLTNKRAFIATDIPFQGRRLQSYPIEKNTQIDLIQAKLSTVHFATEYRQGKRSTAHVPIGFERITDGEHVFRLMRQQQARQK